MVGNASEIVMQSPLIIASSNAASACSFKVGGGVMGWFSVIGFKLEVLVNVQPDGVPHSFPYATLCGRVGVLVSTAPTVTETLLDATLKKGTLVNPHT
jgi:hypothetical protein